MASQDSRETEAEHPDEGCGEHPNDAWGQDRSIKTNAREKHPGSPLPDHNQNGRRKGPPRGRQGNRPAESRRGRLFSESQDGDQGTGADRQHAHEVRP